MLICWYDSECIMLTNWTKLKVLLNKTKKTEYEYIKYMDKHPQYQYNLKWVQQTIIVIYLTTNKIMGLCLL